MLYISRVENKCLEFSEDEFLTLASFGRMLAETANSFLYEYWMKNVYVDAIPTDIV